MILTKFNDDYTGNAESNISWLGAGDDEATTKNGEDTVYTGAGTDIIKTGNHNDTIYAYGGGQKSINPSYGEDLIAIAIDSNNTTVKIEQFNTGGHYDTVRMIVIDSKNANPTEDDISTYETAGSKGQIIYYKDIPGLDDSGISVAEDIGLIMVLDVEFDQYDDDDDLGATIKEDLNNWFKFENSGDEVFIYVASEAAIQAYLYSFQDTNGNKVMESGEILQIADISGVALWSVMSDEKDRMFPDFTSSVYDADA